MGSVERDRAGTAPGINNAVARVAGVLAVAVLGVVMVAAFSYKLQHSLANADVPLAALHQLRSSTVNLGGLEVPSNLDAGTAARVRAAIAGAFIFGFRLIAITCSGLAVASAGVAWRMIPAGEPA